MEASKVITLTSDFGHQDSYVGQLKGSILSIEPDARIIDLCHEIPPQDVAAGAYVLETGYAAFPAGTIHVAVVDPGVGSGRRMLAVLAGAHRFLAPDNGLLARVLERERPWSAHALQNRAFFGPCESATFAGRDVLGPVAAWLSRGVELERLGPTATDLAGLPVARPRLEVGRASRVAVLAVDRFGNAVLDVRLETLTAGLGHPPDEDSALELVAEGGQVTRFHRTYADAPGRDPFFLINSAGYLEIAVACGRAADALGLRAGMHVPLRVGR